MSVGHRESISSWLRTIDVSGKSVVDWGSGAKPAQNYFKGQPADYFAIDKNPRVPTRLLADFSQPVELDKQFDVAFCIEVLEHCTNPFTMMKNVHASLKPGGTLYFSVPFLYDQHHDEDYWRLTESGIKMLFEASKFEVNSLNPSHEQKGWLVQATKL